MTIETRLNSSNNTAIVAVVVAAAVVSTAALVVDLVRFGYYSVILANSYFYSL